MNGSTVICSRTLIVAALGLCTLVGCATGIREPSNLDTHKAEVREYVNTGEYARDLERIARVARVWIEERVASRSRDERLAVVLDLDETLFLNWSRIDESDFTYVRADWDRWVAKASAPAIEPVRQLFHAARRDEVDVILITGRPERHRHDTEINLQRLGCADYQTLICSPDDWKGVASVFKTAQRKRLSETGLTIIANVGDQKSDLVGGYAERTFKLPNPFYLSE
jgi:predicted secreted acid phosphatase